MNNKSEWFLFFILLANSSLSLFLGDMFSFLGWVTAMFIQLRNCKI